MTRLEKGRASMCSAIKWRWAAGLVRTVMQVGPLCDADRDIVRVKVKQLFEAALSEAS